MKTNRPPQLSALSRPRLIVPTPDQKTNPTLPAPFPSPCVGVANHRSQPRCVFCYVPVHFRRYFSVSSIHRILPAHRIGQKHALTLDLLSSTSTGFNTDAGFLHRFPHPTPRYVRGHRERVSDAGFPPGGTRCVRVRWEEINFAVTTPRRADRFPAAKVDQYMFYGFSWIGDVGFGRWARAGCSVENAWAIGPVGRRPASASGAPPDAPPGGRRAGERAAVIGSARCFLFARLRV